MPASASPAFKINGGASGVKASVSAASAVTATLTDITGVRSVAWRISSTDEGSDVSSYALVQSGSVGQNVATTSLAAGTAAIIECTINAGVDNATGLTNYSLTRTTAKFFVPAASGLEVACAQEGYESNATSGWTGIVNAAARAAGGGSAYPFTSTKPPAIGVVSSLGVNATELAHRDHTHAAYGSVRVLGALGDGTTDDTAAIQATLDAAASGQTIFFPLGTYKITSTLTISTDNLRLVGEGRGSIIKAATASLGGDRNMFLVSADNVVFDRLAFEGVATTVAAPTSYAILADTAVSASYGEVRNCYFGGPAGSPTTGLHDGIVIDAGCNHWTIVNNYFGPLIGDDANVGAGTAILVGASSYCEVAFNKMIGSRVTSPVQGHHACYLSSGSSHNDIHDNYVEHYNNAAITHNGGDTQTPINSYNKIHHNTVIGCGSTISGSIDGYGAVVGASIHHNVILDSYGDGISLSDSGVGARCRDNRIYANHIERATRWGILLDGVDRTTVEPDNVVIDCSFGSPTTYAAVGLVASTGIRGGANGATTAYVQPMVGNRIGVTAGTARRFFALLTGGTPVSAQTWSTGFLRIVSMTNSGGSALITSARAHGLAVGQKVAIGGCLGILNLNGGPWTVATVPSATTFTIATAPSGTYTASSGFFYQQVLHGWATGCAARVRRSNTIAINNLGYLATVTSTSSLTLDTSSDAGVNAKTITGSTGNGVTPIVLTVSSTTGLTVHQQVLVDGVVGNTKANGVWNIAAVVDATHVSLESSTGNGAYVSGGTLTPFVEILSPTHSTGVVIGDSVFDTTLLDVVCEPLGYPGVEIGPISVTTGMTIHGDRVICIGDDHQPVATSGSMRVNKNFTLMGRDSLGANVPLLWYDGTNDIVSVGYTNAVESRMTCMTGGVIRLGNSDLNIVSGTTMSVIVPVTMTAGVTVSGGPVSNPRLIIASGANITLNWGNGSNQQVTLGHNAAFAAGGQRDGQPIRLTLIQDGTGSRLPTFSGTYKFVGGTAPTFSTGAGKVDVLEGYSDGTSILITGWGLDVR